MSEMVERVAVALTEEFQSGRRVFNEGEAQALARVAILAMREPTKAMVAAMVRERVEFETGIGWSVMIDEALKR